MPESPGWRGSVERVSGAADELGRRGWDGTAAPGLWATRAGSSVATTTTRVGSSPSRSGSPAHVALEPGHDRTACRGRRSTAACQSSRRTRWRWSGPRQPPWPAAVRQRPEAPTRAAACYAPQSLSRRRHRRRRSPTACARRRGYCQKQRPMPTGRRPPPAAYERRCPAGRRWRIE